MSLALQIRQQQRQAFTSAMWMSCRILPLTVTELGEAVKKEVETNPALEIELPRTPVARPRSSEATADYLENIADEKGESLSEHLLSELRMSGVEGREAQICAAVISEIDGDGRFCGSVPDMQMALGATAAEIESARQLVMRLDPRGCGARDIPECFLAQVDSLPEASRAAARKGIAQLAEALASGKRRDMAPATLALLKKLNPYPGRLYEYRRTDYVVPDVHVDENGDVEVDQRDIPELRVSPKYIEMAKDRSLDAETREFAAARVKAAREFREAVIRRRETLERIAEIAIGGQSDFLKFGVAGLKRQTMSEVAKVAHCTVAAVSRTAARKYVKTPRGTFPLRKFFVLVNQEPIERLRQLLESIPQGKHVSDRELSEMMAKEGFKMARRTVAKYRVKLGFSDKV